MLPSPTPRKPSHRQVFLLALVLAAQLLGLVAALPLALGGLGLHAYRRDPVTG